MRLAMRSDLSLVSAGPCLGRGESHNLRPNRVNQLRPRRGRASRRRQVADDVSFKAGGNARDDGGGPLLLGLEPWVDPHEILRR